MTDKSKCEWCGEPMPDGEDMFKYHGYSGPCPKPPLPKTKDLDAYKEADELRVLLAQEQARGRRLELAMKLAIASESLPFELKGIFEIALSPDAGAKGDGQ